MKRQKDIVLAAVDPILVDKFVVLLGIVDADHARARRGDRVPSHFARIERVGLPWSDLFNLTVDHNDIRGLDHDDSIRIVLVPQPGGAGAGRRRNGGDRYEDKQSQMTKRAKHGKHRARNQNVLRLKRMIDRNLRIANQKPPIQ